MRKIELVIGDMHVTKGFARHVNQIPEDSNILFYKNARYLELDLIRRARAVLGLRGMATANTCSMDGRAIQHGLRMIIGGFSGTFNVDEYIVAEYAVHIANETNYWNCTDSFGEMHWE